MPSASPSPRETLSSVSGLLVRDAEVRDAVQGVSPRAVAEPDTVAQVSSTMRAAFQQGLSVLPRGGGSKLDWADPPRSLDVILDLGRLRGVVDHVAGDMVVVARAGTRLAELQESLARTRQWLALDPGADGATLGGLVATNAAGPRQLSHGRPRDLLIGIEVVLADGTVARSGGRVVKNVAGYDLGKLYSGSLGTLGVIVETTFRLHPIPRSSETLGFDVGSEVDARRAIAAIGDSQLEPSFVTLHWSPRGALRLIVGLAGGVHGVRARRAELESRLAALDGVRVGAAGRPTPSPADCVLRLGFHLADLVRVFAGLREEVEIVGLECDAEIEAAVGVADVRIRGPIEATARLVENLRRRLGTDANVLVRRATPELKCQLGSFDRLAAPADLLRRVKREFDPAGLLSPGRVPWA